MSSLAQVFIHPSQFPDRVRRELADGLRTRQINPKFHYDGARQTRKWLALHQACSPSRTDADCAAAYAAAFEAAATQVTRQATQVIGLGCGGGQKDTRLLRRLRAAGQETGYLATDVSLAMVLAARQTALEAMPDLACHGLVCDLATAEDLPAALRQASPGPTPAPRLLTFFGLLPNFEPRLLLPRLAAAMDPGDSLLLSANLAPGNDYAAGVRQILPLYDNAPTRDWLMVLLHDLGVEPGDGNLRFGIEEPAGGGGLKRIVAWFDFARACELFVETERFPFPPGDSLRLFFSYRHRPEFMRWELAAAGLRLTGQWLAASGEEGIFAAVRG